MDPWIYATAALFGTSLTAPMFYLRARRERQALDLREAEFKKAREAWRATHEKLTAAHDKLAVRHQSLRERILASGMIESIYQPVILVGPKAVGKTSLLSHWRAPWLQVQPSSATLTHSQADVPICDVPAPQEKPHFADSDLSVRTITRLMLRVHDFPGELSAQQAVMQVLQAETRHLRQHARRELGVVVLCMFDAGEVEHGIAEDTRRYYNNDLFKRLGALVRRDMAEIERLILVFNKVDRLRQARSGAVPDSDLLGECESVFMNTFDGLGELCHPGKIIPVLSMLDRENNRVQSRGAPLVLGEAARSMVESVMGERFANKVLTERLRPVSALYAARVPPKGDKGPGG